MSVIDGVARHWIRLAADRWPRDLRDELKTEWTAEMRVMSAFRRLRFAFSLVASPPFEDENGAPLGWRELLPGAGRRIRPFFVLFTAGFATAMVASAVTGVAGRAEQALTGSDLDEPRTTFGIGLFVAITVLGYAGFGLLGTVFARRYPLARGPRSAFARLMWTLAAVGAMTGGMLTQTALFGWGTAPEYASIAMWAGAAAIVCVGAVLLSRGGLPWLGRVLGVSLGLILFDLIGVELGLRIAAERIRGVGSAGETWDAGPFLEPSLVDVSHGPLWFPRALMGSGFNFDRLGEPDWEIPWRMSGMAIAMVLGLLFAVCFTVRTASAPIPERPITVHLRVAPIRRGRPAALVLSGVAVAVWSAALAFLPSRVRRLEGDPEFGIWTCEIRFAAIALTTMALAFALTGRGRALWPSLAAGAVLIIADQILSGTGLPEPTTAAIAAATGGITVWTAWWLGTNVRGIAPPPVVREGRVIIALMAAVTAPGLYLQATWPDSAETETPTPWALPLATAAVCGGLAALAVLAALSARHSPLSVPTGRALLVLATLAFVAGGAVTGLPSDLPKVMVLVCGPWTVAVTALIARDRPARRVRVGLMWTLAGVVAVAAQAIPVFVLFFPAMAAEETLLRGAGFGGAWDGLPTLFMVLATATLYAFITTRTMRRRRSPRTWRPLPAWEPQGEAH